MTDADLFMRLAEPFSESEEKTRTVGGRTLRYITARSCMNRLDETFGPARWWNEYKVGDRYMACRITILLSDGSVVTKEGIGGYPGMASDEDDVKGCESDAFKRACVLFGIARYLYGDGSPPQSSPVSEPTRQASPRQATGDRSGAPRSGRALFAWCKEVERDFPDVLKRVNAFGKSRGYGFKTVDWTADQAEAAYISVCQSLGIGLET